MATFFGTACSNHNKKNTSAENNLTAQAPADSIETKKLSEYFIEKRIGGQVKVQLKNALPENGMGFYVYFMKSKDTVKELKLFIQFEDRDVYQFSVGGQKYTYKSNFSKGKGNNKINWYDYKMSAIDISLLYALIKSGSARIIFGDGTSVVVDKETIEGIKQTLEYFEESGGKYPPYIQ